MVNDNDIGTPQIDLVKRLELAREAFGEIRSRVEKLEKELDTTRQSNVQLRHAIDEDLAFVKKMYAHNQALSVQLDDAIPRMTRAEAALGRAREGMDSLWRLVGENAGGIAKLRELLKSTSAD